MVEAVLVSVDSDLLIVISGVVLLALFVWAVSRSLKKMGISVVRSRPTQRGSAAQPPPAMAAQPAPQQVYAPPAMPVAQAPVVQMPAPPTVNVPFPPAPAAPPPVVEKASPPSGALSASTVEVCYNMVDQAYNTMSTAHQRDDIAGYVEARKKMVYGIIDTIMSDPVFSQPLSGPVPGTQRSAQAKVSVRRMPVGSGPDNP